VLKGHEYGLDVVMMAGEKHLRENVSIPRIYKAFREEYDLPICARSVGNLVDDYVALCECVAGDTDRLRTRLKQQGAMVLSIDGVQYDDRSPVLYVQRDVLSGEVLYAQRRLARGSEDLVPMLEQTRDLAKDMGIPILGVVSDKERGLVPAIAKVFPKTPHQYCQTHYLGNVAKPIGNEARPLEEVARTVVVELRQVQREIQRQESAAKQRQTAPKPPEEPPATPDIAIAAALARAGSTVGAVSGRPITDPAGLKRFRRLQRVQAAVEKAVPKKGGLQGAGRGSANW
jgi:hypothetical protein